MSRLRVGQAFAVAAIVLGLVATGGFVAGVIAIKHLSDSRELLVDQIDPSLDAFQEGYRVVVDQETGVRGFVLSGDEDLLEPYTRAIREGDVLGRRLGALLRIPSLKPVLDEAVAVGVAAKAWQDGYARPSIAAVRRGDRSVRSSAALMRGKTRFDALRRALDREIAALRAIRADARSDLHAAARRVNVVFLTFGAVLLLAGLVVLLFIHRGVSRPISRLTARTRAVAAGDFERPVETSGPRDVRELGQDIDAMRLRILQELRELERREQDLQRSNAELEQFAYVASHDLQEPLRKVSSFTQLLQRRYGGQLDDKADQYIDYAVDGAKRMQVLINDLLAFSRVGRIREDFAEVDLEDAYGQALRSLGTAIEESDAEIVRDGRLPVVRGELSLLALVFQNLIGNALKFRDPDRRPHVHIGVHRTGDCYEVCVRDDGIGISPEYADRIFIIFQRLHAKEDYAGTGIGLAMCRKVVEYHGGQIWLDTGAERGTTFRFTLPVPPDRTEDLAP